MGLTDSLDQFPAGVASFDPTADSVLLWTLCRDVGDLRWELASDERFVEVVASGVTRPAEQSGTVTVDVGDLRAGRTYWYRFVNEAGASPVGRTCTLPDGDASRLRLGFVTCARYGQARFHVYRALATADVDLVVHLGDYIYEDTKTDLDDRRPEPDHDCVTVEDYRRRHLQSRSDPDLQLLHQRHPMVVIWDDHDFADNACRDGAQNHDDQEHGPWSDRLAAALRVHQEFLPKRLADPDDLATAWRHLDAGDLLRILCTETRAHRDAPAGLDGTPRTDDPHRRLLGSRQLEWLRRAVSDSGPVWTMVLSGTVVSELTLDAPDELHAALPEKYAVQDGTAINTDQWDGYEADRAALVAAARRRGGGTVVVSGDIHSAWAVEGPRDHRGAVAVELTCPPAATTPFGQLLPTGAPARLRSFVYRNVPNVRWVDTEHRGYLVMDVTRERIAVSYWWVHADDECDEFEVRLGRRLEVPRDGLPARFVDPDPLSAHDTERGHGRDRWRRVALVGGTAGVLGAAAVATGRWFRRRLSLRGASVIRGQG